MTIGLTPRMTHNRHKSIIDALAKDDEMFRAVKEIAETKDVTFENMEG
ncbi:MAG: hypothetical protein WCE94_11880 [Candidatus Methanoperedens sp.]